MKHWFGWVIGVGMVGLVVMVLLLTRQNAALRAELSERDRAIAALAAQGGLQEGDTVAELRVFDSIGRVGMLAFDEGHKATLLFLVSAGCGACDVVLPRWDAMLADEFDGVRVVAVDAGARTRDSLGVYSERFETLGTAAEDIDWLREIPLTPSAVVIGPGGRVLGAWYGARASSRTGEIRAVLDAAVDAAGG